MRKMPLVVTLNLSNIYTLAGFVDEIGSNTSQVRDGNIEREIFCVQNKADHSNMQH